MSAVGAGVGPLTPAAARYVKQMHATSWHLHITTSSGWDVIQPFDHEWALREQIERMFTFDQQELDSYMAEDASQWCILAEYIASMHVVKIEWDDVNETLTVTRPVGS